ncbi:MAG: O-antigen ligase family protein [Candidatus Nanopelagicales bacterium]|nr:O-antigen ligase family protein [Candidatus Nanopelagicales bacterium]MDZ4248963.1 O-antigen ligase family protein [Candidatus Nanopelagicales bacterium]
MLSSASEAVYLALDLGVLASIVVALLLIVSKAPRLALTIFLAAMLLENNQHFYLLVRLEFGPINVYPSDVFAVAFLVVGLSRLHHAQVRAWARRIGLALTAMVGVGVLSWVTTVGLEAGVNQWRPWILSVAVFWWSATMPGGWSWAKLRPIVWMGFIASGLQAYGLATEGLGSATVIYSRPLFSSAALLMLVALFVLAHTPDVAISVRTVGVVWLGAAVLLAQHRSVWLGALVMTAVAALEMIQHNRKKLELVTLGAFMAMCAILILAYLVSTQPELGASATNTGNLDWRNDQWSTLLEIPRSMLEWLLGSTFGPTNVTDVSSLYYVQRSAHSMYVEAITAVGIIGALLLVAMLIVGLTSRGMRLSTWTTIVAAGLGAFGFVYQWPGWSWLIFGIAASTARPQAATSAPGPGDQIHRTPSRVTSRTNGS